MRRSEGREGRNVLIIISKKIGKRFEQPFYLGRHTKLAHEKIVL